MRALFGLPIAKVAVSVTEESTDRPGDLVHYLRQKGYKH